MNTVDPKIVDQWIAYQIVQNEHDSGKGGMVSPEQARDALEARHGIN